MEDTNEKGLVKVTQAQSIQQFSNFADMDAMMKFVKPLVDAKVFPQDTVGEAVAVMLWAKDKQINLIDAMAHTAVVHGKVSIDSHLSRALLQQHGIFTTFATVNNKLEDYRPLYSWQYRDSIYHQDDIDEFPENFQLFINKTAFEKAHKSEQLDKGKIPVIRSPQPIDVRTTLLFTRVVGNKTLVERGQFTWNEAVKAGLTGKSNWENYPQDCLYARAYMRGARRIGNDVIFGIYSKDEMDQPETFITPEYSIEE